MFDLVGMATLRAEAPPSPQKIRSAFSSDPWTNLPRSIRGGVTSAGCNAVWLSRAGEVPDFAEAEGCRLFLVGEAFVRLDAQEAILGTGRASGPAILRAYLAQGHQVLTRLKGNFAIVLVDGRPSQSRRDPKVLVVSSHFAVSPLYYALAEDAVYFSTSLGEIGRLLPVRPEIDLTAVVETMVINWPVNERTFLRGVKRIAPGTILTIEDGHICREVYWDQRPLYAMPPLPAADALEQGSELFYRCANALVADDERICASFTSGFDSRALHAVLNKDRSQILSYSFGIPGAVNVTIPEKICRDLGYPFQALYLDKRYEDVFDVYARQTVVLSDGVVVQRANYPYAFEKLSEFAPVVATGIFGSEFLRTFQNLGEFVSENFARMNRAADPIAELRVILEEDKARSYVTAETFRASQEEVEADLAEWFASTRSFSPDQRLHYYLIVEASRKYFGAEVSTERVYASNRFPFLDIDFFELIFRAPFAGVHSRAINPTVANRFNSQYFYAYLIRKYRPELLSYPTDHGYAPSDLLKPFPVLSAGRKHVLSKAWGRLTRYREFKPEEWLTDYYRSSLANGGTNGYAFIDRSFGDDFRSGSWLSDVPKFEKVAGLRLWLKEWQ